MPKSSVLFALIGCAIIMCQANPAGAQSMPPLLVPPPLRAGPGASQPVPASKPAVEAPKPACSVTLLQQTGVVRLLPAAGQRVLKFRRSTSAPCLQAAVTSDEWLTAHVDSQADEVILEFEPNTTGTLRTAKVAIATLSRSFNLLVQQPSELLKTGEEQ